MGSLSSFADFFPVSLDVFVFVLVVIPTVVFDIVDVTIIAVEASNGLAPSCSDVIKEGISILFDVNDSDTTFPPCSTSVVYKIRE